MRLAIRSLLFFSNGLQGGQCSHLRSGVCLPGRALWLSVPPWCRWCTVLLPVIKAQLPLLSLPWVLLSIWRMERKAKSCTTASVILSATFLLATAVSSYELHNHCTVPVSCSKVAACNYCHWAALCHRNVFSKGFMQLFAGCYRIQDLLYTSVIA